MATNKLLSLAEAAQRYAADGIQYASGAGLPVGADAVVFGRELVRQGRRNLHALFHCNTQQLNLLAAAGTVDKVECGFSGLEGFGFAKGLSRVVEEGRVALEDYSNLAMALRFLGGALNWPFVPATTNIGSDLQQRSAFEPDAYPATAKIPEMADPFSGRALGAYSPLKPDLAVLHVTLADTEGNAIMIGSEWSRFELSRAAKRLVLVADHIVDTDCMRQYPNLVRIPGLIVDAVVWWPFSAWPAASPGVHDVDEAHMKLMNDWLGSEEGTFRYIDRYIFAWQNVDSYLDLIGRDNIARLEDSPTRFLLDPYRPYILDRERIEQLQAENRILKRAA